MENNTSQKKKVITAERNRILRDLPKKGPYSPYEGNIAETRNELIEEVIKIVTGKLFK